MVSTRSGEASSSSSSSSSSSPYDVFLSFRGLDTRNTFTGHLHTALQQAGFRTFLDSEDLKCGKNIKSELEKAITESKISLVVFSKNYASSRWCLNELVKILQRKNDGGHSVVPIFYNVKATDVRHLSGDFGKAFQRPEEKLKERKEDTGKLQEWKDALQEVADIKGKDLEEDSNGKEPEFIQQIIHEVGEKVGHMKLATDSCLVGINHRAEDIDSWLEDEKTNVHIMIICGMGGIGKTTIAKFLYNINFSKFEGISFLENVRETLGQSRGLHRLQEQLFSDILKNRTKIVHNNSEAISELQKSLSCKKVLIIFDDVDEQDQLDEILGERNWLREGSKIIITTRKESLLSSHEAHKVRRIEPLSLNESLELFSWHAFGKTHPRTSFVHISQTAVDYCEGHPLAIKVLASLLQQHGNHLDKWTDELSKLIESPDEKIFKVLRKSYDSLGVEEKKLFLHIACLFVGKKMDKVIMTLNWMGFRAKIGIDILMKRCMLEADFFHLEMHQLLQEMGRQIVCQESSNELGQRCILWNHIDSFNVLRENTGTGNIKSIVLDGSQLNPSDASTVGCTNKKSLFQELLERSSKLGNSLMRLHFGISLGLEDTTAIAMENIDLETDAFAKMHNLNFLKLKCVQLQGNFENFPRRLRYLKWRGCPLQSIPSNFAMESLVVLNMKYSSLKYLWDGSKNLNSLEILNLRDSHNLRVTPDFSKVPILKQLILANCTSLVELHESIGKLKDLILLDLRNCKNLSKLPGSVGMLNCLDTLDVSGCSRLEEFPLQLENFKTLQVLCANGIREANAWKWKEYIFRGILKPQKIPKIHFPQSLIELKLEICNLSDEDFPSNLSGLFSLKYLFLSNNMISKPPDFIKCLQKLQILALENCKKLKRVTSCGNCSAGVFHHGCRDLVEAEGVFKLEPTENVNVEILSNLGLHWGPPQSTNVKLYKLWVQAKARKFPPQVYSAALFDDKSRCFCQTNPLGNKWLLHCDQKRRWNVFSNWVPRRKVSSCFNYYQKKISTTFTLPPLENTPITQGLTVCIVYEMDNHFNYNSPNILVVHNNSKRLSWVVDFLVVGIPETNEDMRWSTFFEMANHHMEGGDELSVLLPQCYQIKVKEIGVRLLYKEHEQRPTPSTIEQRHTFVKYIPNNMDAYLGSGQNVQGKLKLNASGSSAGKAFGGFITSEGGVWVIGYYANFENPYWCKTEFEDSFPWKPILEGNYLVYKGILGAEMRGCNYLEAELVGIYNGLYLIKDKTCIGVEIETHTRDVFDIIKIANPLQGKDWRLSDRARCIVHDIQEKFKHLYTVKYTKRKGNRDEVAARLAEMGNHTDLEEPFVILEEPPMEIKEILLSNFC